MKSEFDAGVKGTDARIQELRREATFAVGLRRATMLGWARTIDFSIDYSLANEAYAAAFRELGVDILSLDPAAAAEQLEKESARIRELAAQGLDDWRLKDEPNRPRLRKSWIASTKTSGGKSSVPPWTKGILPDSKNWLRPRTSLPDRPNGSASPSVRLGGWRTRARC